MDKPLVKSMTVWGVAIWAVAEALDVTGIVPGLSARMLELMEIVGLAIAGIGARRALGGTS